MSKRNKRMLILGSAVGVVAATVFITYSSMMPQMTPTTSTLPGAVGMVISSVEFNDGSMIPSDFTCDGANISPSLSWSRVPAGANVLALILDDPDAPQQAFTHWVMFNIPTNMPGLPTNITKVGSLPGLGLQGWNDFGQIGYRGPCPPQGSSHSYRFTLYALDATVSLPAGATRDQLVRTMDGHILATARLTGVYGR